ncbi:SH3 domain-containing protein [Leptospira sp. 201903074]|uniref:SH3 domain-containing protein n=1 Tax=Leptospira abararensis TaxID=2810036 RepID=UPI00196319C3|nr:SH3 domain-containing protein [Leptospira abararensis]
MNTNSGLILREKPTKNSNKIVLLPDKTKVKIISELTISDQVDGINGKWIKVQFKDSIGYVFDYYLVFDSEISELKNQFCINSEYRIKKVEKTSIQIQDKLISKQIVNGINFLEYSKLNSNKKILIENRKHFFSSSYTNENFYGNYKEFKTLFISQWDETTGDFADTGYNLYFTNTNPIHYINFHPKNQIANCIYSVVASYAIPRVINKYLENTIISHVSYPNCDFENPPENLNPDTSISTIPTSFSTNSFLVLEISENKINFNEFCDNNLPTPLKGNLNIYKNLDFKPLQ